MGLNNPRETKRTPQYMDNLSFDETYLENTTLSVVEDNINAVLRRQQGDSNGNTLVKVGGSVNLPLSFISSSAVYSVQIKGSKGLVTSLHFFNNSGNIAYVRLYDQTGAPASTDTANIVYRALIPANTNGAGFVITLGAALPFTNGIGIRVTGGVADNDATALSANTIIGNVFID